MAPKRTSRKLNTPETPKPAYVMPDPNSDMEAYGWDLGKIRHPDPKSENPKEPDPGRRIFIARQETPQTMERYGHDAMFICPRYLQILLDQSAEVREAAVAAHAARYTKESIAKVEAAVRDCFNNVVLKDIVSSFDEVAPLVAQFYAARVAHLKKFGKQSEAG